MKKAMILLTEYCVQCQVEQEFVYALHREGLIEIVTESEKSYIRDEQLGELEHFRRLYYDLNINIEGIDAMHHLLNKVKVMREEINQLRNRLRLHEDGW
jgi:chaperone modulatory protein CbpM